jgi:hypothetical protein
MLIKQIKGGIPVPHLRIDGWEEVSMWIKGGIPVHFLGIQENFDERDKKKHR